MRERFKRLLLFLCAFLVLFSQQAGQAAPLTQADTPEENALLLLEQLTPEERVGQLFLVGFQGPEAAPGTPDASQIFKLITDYHIGGVVLTAENNNFVGRDQTVPILLSLTDQLQRNEYGISLQPQTLPDGTLFTPAFIPLLIAVAQDGDGYPYDQILSGVTPMPSQMSLGATWQPELAQRVGEVVGKELSILGINLILGPSLDVLEPHFSETNSDLGVRTFGGDPFWVGQMGQAYITGLHQGSSGKLVVAGKHFPGFGGSDRLPEDEVATVRKTLDQLKQFDLFPFFAVTGNAPTAEAAVDALVTAHIRYQGFQENFRRTTKPVSFDTQAFSNLMSLEPLRTWRSNGGVMISDSLGSRAVRRFYDPSGLTFNGRTVALDAFLAGNDILLLDNFISSGDPDAFTTIVRTLESFSLKYREDDAFAQRVDESVLRILTMKYRAYGNRFTFNETLPEVDQVNQLGQSRQVSFDVARQSATLISPLLSELDTTIPGLNEQIVFFTDLRVYQPCDICLQEQTIAVDALEQTVVRLYTPLVGGPVLPRDLSSYAFTDLQEFLNTSPGQLQVEQDILNAEWLIFLLTDTNPTIPSSFALKRFLDEKPELLQGRRIIVFSMNSPYFLDATEVAKLTAYYALYSRSPQFIEVAARLLFQEILPQGNLPISVPSVGYDLNEITFPDPDQVIPLEFDPALAGLETPTVAEATPETLIFRIGDLLPVRTGMIVDHNGRMVPDGTVVRFILSHGRDTGILQQVEAQTVLGIANATLQIAGQGNFEVRAESDPARQSETLQFVVPPEGVTTTPEPTGTLQPTASPTLEPTITPTLPMVTTPTPPPVVVNQTGFGDWLASLLAASAIAALAYSMTMKYDLRWSIRSAILGLIGGSLTYALLALDPPGASTFLDNAGIWGVILLACAGAAVGCAVAWLWRFLQIRGVIPPV